MDLVTEKEHWDLWAEGESRCPFCDNVDSRDFEAICDCWREGQDARSRILEYSMEGGSVPAPANLYPRSL